MTHVEVAVALVWRGSRLLVARRPASTHLGGLWEFPGGKLKAGETAEAAAVREAREETGVVARAVRLRDRVEHHYPDRRVTLHFVDCVWLEGEARPVQAEDPDWVAAEDLVRLPMPAANRDVVAALAAQGAAAAPRGA